MALYNPQIELEFTVIGQDGFETGDETFLTLLSSNDEKGLLNDYKYHDRNKPIAVEANINKSFTSLNSTASIKIYNHLFVEYFKQYPNTFFDDLENNYHRVRIWAWHDDNGSSAATSRPNIPPVFVGDILQGINIQPLSTSDSVINIQAESNSWLMTSGKMRKTWDAGTNYGTIVQDLMQEIIDRGYGVETRGQTPRYVIEPNTLIKLQAKQLIRSKSITNNPVEELNEICRDFDSVWGIENNVPFYCNRDEYFQPNQVNSTQLNTANRFLWSESSKIGLTSIGIRDFQCSAVWQNEFILGTSYLSSDEGMFNQNGNEIFGFDGRLDTANISLNNVNTAGHTCDMVFGYVDNESNKVRLPQRRLDASGRSLY